MARWIDNLGRTIILPDNAVDGEPSWFTVEGLDKCIFRAVVVFSELRKAEEPGDGRDGSNE